MALGLKPGDEIICPSWTYISTAEAASLLGIKPVFCDVDRATFNMTAKNVEKLINKKTKAIVPVHLYGQSCDMEPILKLAKEYNLFIIEDNAQAIGCDYNGFGDKKYRDYWSYRYYFFFSTKNLGAYGDGGFVTTSDDNLAKKIKMIANHGQSKQYQHKTIGCNSRLDSIQAEVLNIKLKYLDKYNKARNQMAENYNKAFSSVEQLHIPALNKNSTHVYHQYTLRVHPIYRDPLRWYLKGKGIDNRIYYPIPLHKQKVFSKIVDSTYNLPNTNLLSATCLSLPIHTEIENSSQDYIIEQVLNFFK